MLNLYHYNYYIVKTTESNIDVYRLIIGLLGNTQMKIFTFFSTKKITMMTILILQCSKCTVYIIFNFQFGIKFWLHSGRSDNILANRIIIKSYHKSCLNRSVTNAISILEACTFIPDNGHKYISRWNNRYNFFLLYAVLPTYLLKKKKHTHTLLFVINSIYIRHSDLNLKHFQDVHTFRDNC